MLNRIHSLTMTSLLVSGSLAACGSESATGTDGGTNNPDAPPVADAAPPDASPPDAAPPDAHVPMPNLTLMPDRIIPSIYQDSQVFNMNSCSLEEMCVGGSGERELLRFATVNLNNGDADLEVGVPGAGPLWVYSSCHGHYHFQNYAVYELLDATGTVVAAGRKQAFCLEDTDQIDPNANPPELFTCSNQGIHAGWADTYDTYLPCQWIDITGIPEGDYILRIAINPMNILPESNYDDNVFTHPVHLPYVTP